MDVKSMSEPQPYSIMSHVDEVSESPGPTSPVVGLSSVMTDVSAIHEHTSTPTRSGSGFRLDLDRPSIWIGMVAATRSGHVLGDGGPWAATALEPWAELRLPGQHEQQQAHR